MCGQSDVGLDMTQSPIPKMEFAMTRMLSLAVVAAVSLLLMPIQSLSAQDSTSPCEDCPAQTCPSCQTIQFELPGIDIVFDSSEDGKEASTEPTNQHEIAIQLSCGCELPGFAANIPYIGQLFHNARPECCEATASKETCEGCQDCLASCAGCADSCCANSCSITCAKSQTVKNPAGALVRLAGHLQEIEKDEAPKRTELMNELIELRIRNERLEAELEAAHHRLEMMREMCEVKAQNAALKMRLEMLERHAAHSAAHVRLQSVPTSIHPPHNTAPPTYRPFVPASTLNPPQPHSPNVAAPVYPQPSARGHNGPHNHPPISSPNLTPSQSTKSQFRPSDAQRIADQLRNLHKELGEAKKRATKVQEIHR